MPVYVYRNLKTGETFEVEQRITESAWTEHPESGDPVKRLVQPVGIAFRGSGFYVTDSRSSKGGAAKGSAKEGGDAGASSSKTESKGEAKGESKGESSSAASSGAKATTGGGEG